ncbi:MAG: hypothetical protein D6713_05290 [Deltaproteobacteria bacterium]|nr:MAG: hypothetical protein D6713_05290 [Deltaproteobacteria bacterium]
MTLQDLRKRLETLKERALSMVRESAARNDVDAVSFYARIAEDCERALRKLEEVAHTAEALERQMQRGARRVEDEPMPKYQLHARRRERIRERLLFLKDENLLPSAQPEMGAELESPELLTPHERGLMARENWARSLSREKGIVLTELTRTLYETEDGRKVGVAYASELGGKPGFWFLSIPNIPYDVVVFLCETRQGNLLDFVIPTEDLGAQWEDVSTGRAGRQKKVNIRKENGNYTLLLPGGEKVSIGQYLSRHEVLKGSRK